MASLPQPTENDLAIKALKDALASGYRLEIYRLNVRVDITSKSIILSPADLPARDEERGSQVGNNARSSTCGYCGGKGTVRFDHGTGPVTCPECRGTGVEP